MVAVAATDGEDALASIGPPNERRADLATAGHAGEGQPCARLGVDLGDGGVWIEATDGWYGRVVSHGGRDASLRPHDQPAWV
jgi:hypothetical protein